MHNDVKEEFYNIVVTESSDLIERIKKHPFNVELMNNTLDYQLQPAKAGGLKKRL